MSDLKLDQIGLSPRALNALMRARLDSVDQLRCMSWTELMCVRGIGRGIAKEIYETMQRLRPMTNADRIRAMSDEELSKFLWDVSYGYTEPWTAAFKTEFCDRCESHDCGMDGDHDCPHGEDVAWWLQQPANDVLTTHEIKQEEQK